jgi:TRAP-type transport system small permease protein
LSRNLKGETVGSVSHVGIPAGDIGRLAKIINLVDRAIARLEEAAAIFSLVSMVVSIFVEVLFRYVFNAPLAWTEELARLSMIWLTFSAGAIVFRCRAHIRIDLLLDLLPDVLRDMLIWLIEIGLVIVLLVLASTGWMMTVIFWPSKTPAIELPVGIMYLPVTLFSTAMLFHSMAIWVRGETTKLPSSVETEARQ